MQECQPYGAIVASWWGCSLLLGEFWNMVEHALRLLSGLTQLWSVGEEGHECWRVVRLHAKGMEHPECLNIVERLIPLLKVQLILTYLLLAGTKRTSKPYILCTQPCSSRPCWFSSSLWSGRKHCRRLTHNLTLQGYNGVPLVGYKLRPACLTSHLRVTHLMLFPPVSDPRSTQTQEMLLWKLAEFSALCCSFYPA